MAGKTYKIKISQDRTLGPLDMPRVEALVLKGRIQGSEPTSVEPFTQWKPFSAFPELGELLLKKFEYDAKKEKQTAAPPPKPTESPSDASTRTLMASQPTRTIAQGETKSLPSVGGEDDQDKDQGSYGIPTLVNIEPPEVQANPDTEKTMLHISLPPALKAAIPGEEPEDDQDDGKTKVLKTYVVEKALEPYVAPPPVVDKEGFLVEEKEKTIIGNFKIKQKVRIDTKTGKRRLLSKSAFMILALLIAGAAYIQFRDDTTAEEQNPNNIVPRVFRFPYVEVNPPPTLGNKPDAEASFELMEKARDLMDRENPSDYLKAIKSYLYTAVGKNPGDLAARGLLASAYIRIAEIIPRDDRLQNTLGKLLLPQPQANKMNPDYAAGRAEHLMLLQRFDQAQDLLDTYLRIRPTAELLYQRARVASEKKELDTALSFINRAIPPEETHKSNPRHLLFWAKLLEKKGQPEPVKQAAQRLAREFPNYGAGILWVSEQLVKEGKLQDAKKHLKRVLDRPYLLDRIALCDAFLLAAKILEAQKDFSRAILFAEAAKKNHYNQDMVNDILFRLRANNPNNQQQSGAYSLVVSARQKEKSKEYDLAQNMYYRALGIQKDPAIYTLMGNLNERLNKIPEAVERYQTAIETNMKSIDPILFLANIYIERFDLEKANEMVKRAKGLGQRKDLVEYLTGRIFLKQGQKELAEASYEKALHAGSRNVDLFIESGDIESAKNNRELAEFYYAMALRYDPLNSKAMLGLAMTRFYLESPSLAIAFLKDKLAAQPNSAAIMTSLAIIYLRSGDQDSGKHYLENAIKTDKTYAQAFKLLGDLTRDEGDHQKDYGSRKRSYQYALASYEMYSRLAPNDPAGYKATADLYFAVRDLGSAAKNFYKVLELAPNYPDVRLKLAQISRNGGAADKAIELLNQELKVNPRSDAALVEKGNIYMAKREFANATEAFTAAARINETNAGALYGLGVVHHLQGNYDNALSLFERVIKLNPLYAEAHWQMGLIYQKLNNRTKAIQAINNYKGLSVDPDDVKKADNKLRELMGGAGK